VRGEEGICEFATAAALKKNALLWRSFALFFVYWEVIFLFIKLCTMAQGALKSGGGKKKQTAANRHGKLIKNKKGTQ
jgi:hypothetical protein